MPQCEDGYTKIANELLEAFGLIRIPGEARQVLDVIIRKTYGWGKKMDAISLEQFCLTTGLKKPNVVRAIKKLLTMNLIIKKDNGYVAMYGINKTYSTWQRLSKKITLSKAIISVIEKDKKPLSKKIPTKESIKETITKERGSRFTPPVLQEVKDYCTERKNNIDPQLFIDHYETVEWMRGKNKIKSWKACIRTWEKRDNTTPQASEKADMTKKEIARYRKSIASAKHDLEYIEQLPEDELTDTLRAQAKQYRAGIARDEAEISKLRG